MNRYRILAGALALTLALAGCGGGSADKTDPAKPTGLQRGPVGKDDPSLKPVSGGTLTYALASAAKTLDPGAEYGAGSSGGSELTALYDQLVRYDAATGKYVPQLAKSVTSNADATVWTIGLRTGVTFSDGTPLDAAAVKFNLERYIAKKQGWSKLVAEAVKSVGAPDATTAVITLNRSWADFAFLLAQAPGNIASPTAVAKYGDAYMKNPVGAGPFMLESWTPGQELVLKANPNYWDGKPYLDKLRFIPILGDQALYDVLESGGAEMAFLGNPQIVRKAAFGKYKGQVELQNTGTILVINNGAGANPNRPGKDVDVRLAIAHAIDPKVIDKRAFGGEGLPGTELFLTTSKWSNTTGGPQYDPAQAKQHLAAAKAKGFDGKLALTYLTTSADPALTVQAMLNAVGFNVEAVPVRTTQDLITAVNVTSDFDIAFYGASVPDEPGEMFARLYDRFARQGNFVGYSNPEMTQVLLDFSGTQDEAKKKELAARIQKLWTETVPSLPLAAAPQMVTWPSKVNGVTTSAQLQVLFQKAWINPA